MTIDLSNIPEELRMTAEELSAAEAELCRYDRARRIEHHVWIKKADGKIDLCRPMKPSQKKVMNLIWWLRVRDQPVRVIVLKARKTGISTVIESDMFFEVVDREIDGLVIAHDMDTAKYLFQMSQMVYERYNQWKPQAKRQNIKELSFIQHKGRILVTTAGNKMAGTGMTPQYVHGSEGSKWETGRETAISLFQAVADKPGTTMIHESTANGYDDLFYPMWRDAHQNCRVTFNSDCTVRQVEITNPRHWNYYYPVFISVFDDPDCYKPFGSTVEKEQFAQTLDDYERHLIESGTGTMEYLNYRRYTIKNKCQNDLDIYWQEHPETCDQAFLSSGRPRFNRTAIGQMKLEEGRCGRIVKIERSWDTKLQFQEDAQDFLKIFRTPQEGHRYVIGVDSSEGKSVEGCKRADSSVIMVLDKDENARQVAVFDSKALIPVEALVPYIEVIGRYYNLAYLVVEINGPGTTIPEHLMGPEFRYPEDRFMHIDDWKGGVSNRSAGWRTTLVNRNNLITDLADYIYQQAIIVHDAETQTQLMNFVWKESGRVEAQKGFHDDHVLALALAVQGCKHYPAFNLHDPSIQRQMLAARAARRRTADELSGY